VTNPSKKKKKRERTTGSQFILTSESYLLLPKTTYALFEKIKNNFVYRTSFRLNQAALWKLDFGMLLLSLLPLRRSYVPFPFLSISTARHNK